MILEETPPRSRSLWRSPDFLKFWTGQTVSELGSHITRDGLPLLAVINLAASPFQMGLLTALGSAPALLISLFAGVWVDRIHRRPILIAADLGRALLLATIPLAALGGWLSMAQVYIVVALTGAITIFFSAAYHAYLPSLVERDHIIEGNAKLAMSSSATEVIGPGLTGFLVQTITAPIAILFDALSFLFSAASLAIIRKPEPPPAPVEKRQSMLIEAREGLGAVIHQPILRALAGALSTSSFFGSFFGVLYGLYAIRILQMTPTALGVTIGFGGVGSLVGALLAGRAVRRFGLGPTLIGCLWLEVIFGLLTPLAAAVPSLAVLMLSIAQLSDALGTIYFINAMSLRQSITPDRLLGRVNASIDLLAAVIGLVGALVGGLLGSVIGIQATLFIAVLGQILSGLWLFFSPIRKLTEI